jgi:hypothetical protein
VDSESLFDLIRALTIVLAALLVLSSTAALGRQLADLEYQTSAKLNGIRWIQSWVNLRIHTNRILLGLTFVLTSILGLIDVPIDYRLWVSGILIVLLLTSYVVCAFLDWMAERKQVDILIHKMPEDTISIIRVKGHLIRNKLATVLGMCELIKNTAQPDIMQNITELDAVLNSTIEEFDTIQTLLRSMSPSYKSVEEVYHDS